MKRSGVIYPNPQDSDTADRIYGSVKKGNADNLFANNPVPGMLGNNPAGLESGGMEAGGKRNIPIGENSFSDDIYGFDKGNDFAADSLGGANIDSYGLTPGYPEDLLNTSENEVVNDKARGKMDAERINEALFDSQADKPRKFASDEDYTPAVNDKGENSKKTDGIVTARQANLHNTSFAKAEEKNDKEEKSGQETSSGKKITGSENKTKLIREKINKVVSRTDAKNSGGKQEKEGGKRESVFLNLMFIFEIFNWFSGSDIIVRIIIGAVVGAVGFGFIFTQMGLLSNL